MAQKNKLQVSVVSGRRFVQQAPPKMGKMLELLGLHPGYAVYVVTFLNLVQKIIDAVLGTLVGYTTRYGWKAEQKDKQGQYAQIVRIAYRGAFSNLFHHQLPNFLLLHRRWVNPRELLSMDRAVLMGLDPKRAWFSVSRPGDDFTDTSRHPFVMMAQFDHAQDLIVVEMDTFHKLAAELGDPPAEKDVVGIMHTARCGSTLVAQLFQRLPDTLVVNEPWPLWHLQDHYLRGNIAGGMPECRIIVRSSLRLQCKPQVQNQRRVVIKFGNSNAPFTKVIREVFPCMKLVMSVRDPKGSIESHVQTWQSKQIRLYREKQRQQHHYYNIPLDIENKQTLELQRELASQKRTDYFVDIAWSQAVAWHYYLHHKDLFNFCAVYGDILSRPEETVGAMLSSLGMSSDLVPQALTALQKHSQKNVFEGGKKKVEIKHLYRVLTDDDWREADKIMKRLELPFGIDVDKEEFAKFFRT